jgi:hypothetical protein
MTKRQIELLRDLGHLLREIREMTDDEARQILDRAESIQFQPIPTQSCCNARFASRVRAAEKGRRRSAGCHLI